MLWLASLCHLAFEIGACGIFKLALPCVYDFRVQHALGRPQLFSDEFFVGLVGGGFDQALH